MESVKRILENSRKQSMIPMLTASHRAEILLVCDDQRPYPSAQLRTIWSLSLSAACKQSKPLG